MADKILTGKVVIMTGAGRGLGRAMAHGLAEAGANVTMVDLDRDVLMESAKSVERVGGQGCALPVVADVTSQDNAKDVIAKTLDRFGKISVLVNDAAIGPQAVTKDLFRQPPKFWETDLAMWQRMMAVNAYGTHLMSATVAPHMVERGWGRIINVTTSLDTMYLKGCGAYGPSKAASEANTAIMATDLEGTGVTANVLVPGGPANTRMIPDEGIYAKRDQLIQPEVMVPPLLWLISPAADGINARRFRAAAWDPKLAPEKAAEAAGAPIAWTGLGRQSIHPKG
jgi:NAD(P)-dependent dehydrogenase (short-subunit alcohol dehydrogenase family)